MDEGSSNNRIGNQGRTPTADVSSKRRRLTAAAFAAPVIVTVSSPRSAAAASLPVAERLDQQWALANETQPAVVGSDPMDGVQWARDLESETTIYQVRLKSGDNTPLLAFNDGTSYRSIAWPGDILDVKTSGSNGPTPWGSGRKLMFFTYDGQTLTETATGTPLTASIWASIGVTPL